MILSGLGLAFFNRTVWGLFVFGVLGIAVAWSLSTLMMVWVNDGVEKSDQPSTFGLLHAVWSVSMITGSVIGGGLAGSLPGLPFLIAGSMNILSLLLIQRYYRKVPVYRSSLTIEQGQ
jgi:MFS family permease